MDVNESKYTQNKINTISYHKIKLKAVNKLLRSLYNKFKFLLTSFLTSFIPHSALWIYKKTYL